MLLDLKVTNFAVIDSMRVNFLRPGLNVLTGETGAGKSVLLKSLGLLLGGKAQPDLIRAGQDQAVIEGAFDLTERSDIRRELENLGMDSGEPIMVIQRIVSRTGRHRISINGHLATLNILESLTSQLIEITGQHEHHSLTRSQVQLTLLDVFSKSMASRQDYESLFGKLKILEEERLRIESTSSQRAGQIDFLTFQIQEIDQFSPGIEDETELHQKYQKARSATKLQGFAEMAEANLYSGEANLTGILTNLIREGEPLSELEPKFRPVIQNLRSCLAMAEDASFELRDYLKSAGENELDIGRLEERITSLRRLQRKFGESVESIIQKRRDLEAELADLKRADERLAEIFVEIRQTQKSLLEVGRKLTSLRQVGAKKLALGINKQLQDLNMKGVSFELQMNTHDTPMPHGLDEVSFCIRSPGQNLPLPVARYASGGELSRIMLAIKNVVSNHEVPMTYLFDEVDTGVSGPTAEKVGKKLRDIGGRNQVVCITHLPQVAAFADAHFLISKTVTKGLVKSDVRELTAEERAQELGRLISGEQTTKAGLMHAKEMLKQSRRPKNSRI
ncbi:MAG: DNA repair protein RecN [Oligoflexia bacterium]|nr:DNA repair protein RecN [Oligoflexia bacterium]